MIPFCTKIAKTKTTEFIMAIDRNIKGASNMWVTFHFVAIQHQTPEARGYQTDKGKASRICLKPFK